MTIPNPADALNLRIDKLVNKLDELIAEQKAQGVEVQRQARKRARSTKITSGLVMALAVALLCVALVQNNATKHSVCVSQNDTRGVVRAQLQAALDNAQIAQAKVYYQTQIAKVGPMHC